MTIGHKIRKFRESKTALSLRALAEQIGMDPAALSRIETGAVSNPTWDTLLRIAEGLGASIEEINRDIPTPTPGDSTQAAEVAVG